MTGRPHSDLMAQLRAAHKGFEAPKLTDEAELAPWPTPSLADLEAYERIAISHAAADQLGVASPFFRALDGSAGTEAVMEGAARVNFASYDYLSINHHKALATDVAEAVQHHGVSVSASRLVGGERGLHQDLERAIASFLGTEDAAVMVSGYLTNLSAIRTLMGEGDLVLADARAHNSIYEGIRVSQATHVSFPHNDPDWVDDYLETNRQTFRRVLIAIEGLYSMDGDTPDLARFVELKKKYGAWLLLDEAHSIGVLGASGRGLCEEQNVDPRDVDVIMGTLSKSLCSCGGFLAGSKVLGELIRFGAPGFVYSVGLSVPNTVAARTALRLLETEPERVVRLRNLSRRFQEIAHRLGLDTAEAEPYAVQPIIIGDSLRAVWVSNALLAEGFNVLPIIAPAVPNQAARLRFFLNADHTAEDITRVLEVTAGLIERSKDQFQRAG
ncbi:MAG: aminotransferase class I/II-fold pyridoxal phosphate-dependent enzyme [Silicimonas sp.]|nr:aminotransferase class I/II-fold pyridoxal phosphate-dependent enzyme [Silicimonas sp.]